MSATLLCSAAMLVGSACDNPPQESAPTDAGSDRGAWPIDVGVPDDWQDGDEPSCPEQLGLDPACDYVARELPVAPAVGGGGGAGGFAGAGAAPTLDCLWPIGDGLAEDMDLDTVNVALNCTVIPYLPENAAPPPGTDDAWHFDDPEEPSGIVLSDSACAAAHAGDVGRMDLILGCPTLNAP